MLKKQWHEQRELSKVLVSVVAATIETIELLGSNSSILFMINMIVEHPLTKQATVYDSSDGKLVMSTKP